MDDQGGISFSMDQSMRQRLAQGDASWFYPAVEQTAIKSDAELFAKYRRSMGYNRVLVAVSSVMFISILFRAVQK